MAVVCRGSLREKNDNLEKHLLGEWERYGDYIALQSPERDVKMVRQLCNTSCSRERNRALKCRRILTSFSSSEQTSKKRAMWRPWTTVLTLENLCLIYEWNTKWFTAKNNSSRVPKKARKGSFLGYICIFDLFGRFGQLWWTGSHLWSGNSLLDPKNLLR